MADILLIDTDVIIDYLRGRAEAVAYIEGLTNPFLLSAVTVAELYSGVREGDERKVLLPSFPPLRSFPLTRRLLSKVDYIAGTTVRVTMSGCRMP